MPRDPSSNDRSAKVNRDTVPGRCLRFHRTTFIASTTLLIDAVSRKTDRRDTARALVSFETSQQNQLVKPVSGLATVRPSDGHQGYTDGERAQRVALL